MAELTHLSAAGMMTPMTTIKLWLERALVLLLASLILTSSALPAEEQTARVRAFTRQIEFDYVSWTLDALGVKLEQAGLRTNLYSSSELVSQTVLDYLELVRRIQDGENRLTTIYSDPDVQDPEAQSASLRAELQDMYDLRVSLGPLAETILQMQLSRTLNTLNFTLGGQPVPPILYHSTPLPMALIISPRDAIRQDENISLLPEMTVDQQIELEKNVDQTLDVSSLVVGIGGVGTYPTMVMQTSDINWLAEVVAHEWIHNYLTLRPLGLSYLSSPELRTMNETTAAIAGKEIGRALVAEFYPQLLPPPPAEPRLEPAPGSQPPAFDFRAEMHTTRLEVDRLLAEGKIEDAENYMEVRREFLWENGYRIRKLNQAYFAFYGAYADQPGGAAGEDPVGAAVRELRKNNPSLAAFVNQMSWMISYQQLQKALPEQAVGVITGKMEPIFCSMEMSF